MRTFYQTLAGIEKRPLMYLRHLSISEVFVFELGITVEVGITGSKNPEDLEDFYNFHYWVRDYYGYKEATSGWINMISDHIPVEEQAFNKFFELFHRFLDGERPPANPNDLDNYFGDDWVDAYLAKREVRKQAALEETEEGK